MHHCNEGLAMDKPVNERSPIWRQALTSVFGAAHRLHRYRDAQDVLLRKVIQEEERRIRQQACCDEQL